MVMLQVAAVDFVLKSQSADPSQPRARHRNTPPVQSNPTILFCPSESIVSLDLSHAISLRWLC